MHGFFFGFVSIHFLIKGCDKETYTLEGKMTSDKATEERMAFKGPQTTPTPERRWTFYGAAEERMGFRGP